MFKEKVLLGQYYPTASPVHRLHACGKLIVVFLYMAALFVVNSWLGWGVLTGVCLLTVLLSRVPLRALWRGLKLILIFALLTVVINAFFYGGEHVLWQWRSLCLTTEGVSWGLAMGLRLLLLVAFASLLTLTTTPIALTDGLEDLLSPLRRLHVPAHEIAMMMSIALRFIPMILEEFDRLLLAQRARGANIGGRGRLDKRLLSFVPLLVPLFVAALRRAEDLAQAMEAKCYQGGEGRTRWKLQPWRFCDTLTLMLFCLLLAAAIAQRIWL